MFLVTVTIYVNKGNQLIEVNKNDNTNTYNSDFVNYLSQLFKSQATTTITNGGMTLTYDGADKVTIATPSADSTELAQSTFIFNISNSEIFTIFFKSL